MYGNLASRVENRFIAEAINRLRKQARLGPDLVLQIQPRLVSVLAPLPVGRGPGSFGAAATTATSTTPSRTGATTTPPHTSAAHLSARKEAACARISPCATRRSLPALLLPSPSLPEASAPHSDPLDPPDPPCAPAPVPAGTWGPAPLHPSARSSPLAPGSDRPLPPPPSPPEAASRALLALLIACSSSGRQTSSASRSAFSRTPCGLRAATSSSTCCRRV